MTKVNFADAHALFLEALKAVNAGARAAKAKQNAAGRLRDVAEKLHEQYGVTEASLSGGGKGGKGQKGQHFDTVMTWVAEAELNPAELELFMSGETGRGTPGAKVRNKVSQKVSRIRAAFATPEEKTFWEAVQAALATQRNKFEQAPLADTERREEMLAAMGGEKKAKQYLAAFDELIAKLPSK